MIGYLRGCPLKTTEQSILLDVQGVGYEVFCSKETLEKANSDRTSLYIYTQVREDVIQLYGFFTLKEKELFLSLIKVNGIGPKLALGILSGAGVEALSSYIKEKNVKALSSLPKIGKKKAEQIILSLKGNLEFVENTEKVFPAKEEILSALVHLGFRCSEVEQAVDDLSPKVDVQEGLKEVLQKLTHI